jgi:hypothetical protein
MLLEHQLRHALNARQQVGIAHQVGHAHLRQAGLSRAEQLTGAAQLEIAARDLEAVVGLAQHAQPLASQLRQGRPIQQDAGARMLAPTDAAAQLVQLRETHALGVLDHHQARVHVHDFDDRGGDEQLRRGATISSPRPSAAASVHAMQDRFQAMRRVSPQFSPPVLAQHIRLVDWQADPVHLSSFAAGVGCIQPPRRGVPGRAAAAGRRPGGSSSITDTSRSA